MYRHLNRLDIPLELYAPYGTPHEELQIEFLEEEALHANNGGNGHSATQKSERIKPAVGDNGNGTKKDNAGPGVRHRAP
jgi:hypothetical protein